MVVRMQVESIGYPFGTVPGPERGSGTASDVHYCPTHRWTQTESRTGAQKTARVQKEEGRDRHGSEELRGSRSGEERVRRV